VAGRVHLAWSVARLAAIISKAKAHPTRLTGGAVIAVSLVAPVRLSFDDVAMGHARVMLAVAASYLVRQAVHWLIRYSRQPQARQRGTRDFCLRRLMRIDGGLALAYLGGAVWCTYDPSTTRILVISAVAWPAMALISAGKVRVAGKLHLDRGSEWLRKQGWVRELRKWLKVGNRNVVLRQVERLIAFSTPKRKLSAYVAAVLVLTGGIVTSSLEAYGLHRWAPSVFAATRPLASSASQEPSPSLPTASLPADKAGLQISEGLVASTYEDVCDAAVRPGDPAPDPQRSLLRARWEGDRQTEGLGAKVAGCAEPARVMYLHPDIWWTVGMCGSELRSLAVASTRGSAILLQGAAKFAEPFAQHGSLLGAEDRAQLRTGDFQVVLTSAGNYVLIRQNSSTGTAALTPASGHCQPYDDGNVRYVALPPALAVLWLQFSAGGWTWPVADGGSARRYRFIGSQAGDQTEAEGGCDDHGACWLHGRGQHLSSGSGGSVSSAQIKLISDSVG
jgi:hypothetical protein